MQYTKTKLIDADSTTCPRLVERLERGDIMLISVSMNQVVKQSNWLLEFRQMNRYRLTA